MSKTRMGKRVASLLLSLVMMLSLLPTTVYAEGADTGDTTDAVVGQATTSGDNTEGTGEPEPTGEGEDGSANVTEGEDGAATNDAVVEETIAPVNAEGVDAVANAESSGDEVSGEDGTVTPATTNAVAQIGETTYATLQEAINAANAGDIVTLLKDVNENVEIAKERNLTLDLNGKILNGGTSTAKAALYNLGTITIRDTSEAKTGTIKRDDNGTVGETSYYVILNQGTMIIESGTVTNNSGIKGSSLICNDAGTLTIKDGTFTQENFIAIKNDALGVLYVTGGTITSNQSAIQNWYKADITGGEIKGLLWTDAWTVDGSVGETKFGGNAKFTGEIRLDNTGSSVPPTLAITGGELHVTWHITSEAANVGAKPAVSGGTFTSEVPAEYCAEGFIPVKNADGSYGVKGGVYVAQIGDVKYETLKEAINAANTGNTIVLLVDVNLTSAQTIRKQLTIDLNGKTISSTAYRTIQLNAGANLTVKDSASGGKITNAYTGSSNPSTIYLNGAGAKFTLESGTIESDPNKTNLQSVAINSERNKACEVNIKGGSVTVPEAATQGRAIVASTNSMTLNISGGTIAGGLHGVDAYSGSTVKITGGEITARYVDTGVIKEAYGMRLTGTANVTVAGGTITGVKMNDNGNDLPKVTLASGRVNGSFYSIVTSYKPQPEFTVAENATIVLANDSAAKFLPDTVKLVQNADGTYGIKAGTYVAQIGETTYGTLAEAIAAAKDGDTVTLLADCSGNGIVVDGEKFATKGLTVDFGGHTYTVGGVLVGSAGTGTNAFQLLKGGKVTFQNGTILGVSENTKPAEDTPNWHGAPALVIQNYCDLTLKNMTISGGDETVYTMSNNHGTVVIEDSTITAGGAKGYGYGPFAFDVCGYSDYDGVSVTVKGNSTINGDIEISRVSNDKDVTLSLESGTISGVLKIDNSIANSTATTTVTKGADVTLDAPTGYLWDEGTLAKAVAEVNGTQYATLQAAIDAATRNQTVTMLANTEENVTIAEALTLDLNGFTLNGGTVAGKPALTVKARVTVKDSSEAQTGTIMREDTAENSGVSSHYVIDIQGRGVVMTFESGNVKNNSGNADRSKGASLVRVGDDSITDKKANPTLTIYGGTFTQDNFIVIKVDRGYLNLNGGTLNSANTYAVENWFRATIKGGTVNGAVSSWTYSDGSNSTLTIEGGTVNGGVTSVNYGNADKVAKVAITGGIVNGQLDTRSYDPNTGELTSIDDAAKATIKVSGGTFNNAVETRYCDEGYTPVQISDGKYGVQQQQQVLAKIGDTAYYTMEDAFQAQTNGDTIVLLRDYTTGGTFNSGSINRTVDLNGHTWTCTGTDANSAAFEINYPNASLTVKNGKIVSSQLVGLIPSAMGGTIKYDNSSLTFENVEMSTTATSGIETNGNNTNDTVTLKNSTLNVPNGFGIYFPSSGKLTIDNSTITAKTMGVQVCAGSLSINAGSTITVTGDAVLKTENDGAIQDGAAISIVNRGYKPFGEIAITGGTFESKVAAIKAYDWDNTNKVEKTFTANEKVAVSGGSFSSAVPEGLCAEGYIPTKNEGGTHGVKEGTYVAEYNGTKYTSLQEAIDAASHRNGGQTEVKLLCDLTITETVNFAKEYSVGSVLLNLGGYTLTGEDCRALQINKGNLYLENGTVTSTGIIDSSSVIRIGSNEATYNGATPMLYMQKDAKVVAPDSYGVTIFGSATRGEKLKVMSNAEIIATGPSPAISGNGGANYNTDDRTSGWKAEEIIIGENAVISAANNYAIYHPECGKLDIQGGTITGTGGIQMCSGTLKISNSPKITANGSADYDYTGDAGVVYDAAAISVINRGYPQGPATATIKGTPTVTAANGEVIHAFTWSNSNKTDGDWAEAGDNINVSGGTYSKTFNPAYLAADCTLVAGENGAYTVEQKPVAEYNGNKYTSLSQAIRDANNAGGTVKLLDNVTLTNSLGIGGTAKVTLNLNKKALTLDGAQIYTQGSAAVTINNGTIKRIDTPTSGSANNFAIQVMSGSTLLLGGSMVTKKLTLTGKYGIYNVGGLLNVQFADITTDGWSIAVSDSASKTGSVIIGSVGNAKIVSQNGNCIGTAVNSKPNVTISKGTLTSNGTTWDAGVVYWASEGTLTITGGTFTASSAEGSEAAAVYQKNGTVKISGTTAKLLGSNALVVKSGEGSTGTMVTELSGGTYSTRPEEAWVVEGKEIHEVDGLYKVEGPYVVEVIFENGTVTKYDSWFSAFTKGTAQYKNATVKLLKDIETTTLVSTYANVTIDFNGHTLAVSSSNENDVAAITALTKDTAANITLKDSVGNGGMKTTGVYGVTVSGTGATATVKSGSYNCDTSVVQVENGTAYIEGGTFQTEDTDKSFLLNCIDKNYGAGTAHITVTGGTFYGFDPSANPEGEGTTYVKTGYVSTNNGDGTYTVEEYKPVEVWTGYTGTKVASYATIGEAVANLGDNKWIVITKNYTLTEDFTISNGVYLDVTKDATLTVAKDVTLTVAANAKRLGVREDATVVNNGTILVCGSSTKNGFAMLYGTFIGNELTVPTGCFLDNNNKNFFATANENAVYEITFGDGTVKKTADSTNIEGGNVKQIKLLQNVTKGGWTLDSRSVGPEVVLDLNGHELSYDGANRYYATLNVYTKVTIKNGTVKYEGSERGAIDLVGQGDLTIESDVTINGGNAFAIFTSGTSKLTVNGIVETNGNYAIAGNGSKDADGYIDSCNITVNDGASIKAPKGIAIYHPEKGTVTINGGTITGHTGVQMCSGELVINGGTIVTTGAKGNIGNDGGILDGAAVSIINRSYPGGTPTATIAGGTFTSANGIVAVQAYTVSGTTASEWTDVAKYVNISGGTFSSIPDNMAALCKVGYRAVEDNNVYIVKEGKYVIEVTSRIQDTNQTVATPTGGGQADYGEEVTVTTYAVTGFTFLGWYDSEGNQLSTKDDMTYTHKVTGDCTLIAKYAQDSTRMFRLTVNGTVFTVNERTEYAHHYSELASGSRVAIVYTGTDNFLYWVNASKNVVTTSETLEYTMVNDAEFTAVTAPATSDSAIVVFKNNIERGQELQARRYYSNETIVFPATPSSYGKTFAYWAILDTNGNILKDQAGNAVVATESAIKAKIAEGTGYIVVAAVYTANGYYKATAHFVDSNGNTVANDMVNANVPTGSGWQVTAPDVKNKFFSHWKDADDNVLSTNQTYAIYAMDTVEVTAVYVDTENDKHATMNTVKLTALTRVVGNSHDLGLVAQYDVASGKTINRVGILFTTNANDKDSLTLENEKALTSTPLDNPENNSNVYRHWLNGINNLSTVVYARAYVTTTDGETIYSEVIEGSFNSWNGN